jgi:membrane protease YdiL (CAAX protease family)
MVVLALIVVPLGLVTQFITPGAPTFDLLDWLSTAVTIFLFVALPEEILFRGALLSHLQDTYRWSDPVTIGVSALIFGASHLNNPPNVGWYFVLATVAGVFYARTYLMTKNVAASAVLHTIVNWLWATIFRG